ncbi:MAG TPA: hypothetical protein VMS88_06090 [Terriglobales bacterium]|nr:hypothetical protein [Terriglobales bacterium]
MLPRIWALGAAFALLAAAPGPSAVAAELTWTPGFAYLGSFSTLDPLDTKVIPAQTAFHVRSDVDWQLEIRLGGPFRRTADGLTLPLERVPEGHPTVPAWIRGRVPFIAATGSGSPELRDLTHDWNEVTTALGDYLERGDPPGTYEGTLLTRLLGSSGEPSTDFVPVTIQFDVEPWVEIVRQDLPDFHVVLPDGLLDGASEEAVLSITSNSSWWLTVSGEQAGRPVQATGFDVERLSLCVAAGSGLGSWRLLGPECQPVGMDPRPFVAGDAPQPFTVATGEIPVAMRFQTDQAIRAGTYGATVRFSAKVGTPRP